MTASSSRPATEHDGPPPAIDQTHLSRMTLGDRRLEREVLEIFMRQSALMLDRIAGAEPAAAAAAAHTLLGSARGIGAWRVARAAEWLERAAGTQSDADVAEAIAELKTASLEASAAIGSRLTVLLSEGARGR
jgi:HPt (histidine-containing phosphotransfer) domain-containing protein